MRLLGSGWWAKLLEMFAVWLWDKFDRPLQTSWEGVMLLTEAEVVVKSLTTEISLQLEIPLVR